MIWLFLFTFLLLRGAVLAQQDAIIQILSESGGKFVFKPVNYAGGPERTGLGDFYHTVVDVRSINDAGVAVGSVMANQYFATGFVEVNEKFTFVSGPLYKGQYTAAIAINNRGQVLVSQDPQNTSPVRYFVYDIAQRTFSPIGFFAQVAGIPDKVRVALTGFNDSGQFVGSFGFHGKLHAGYGTLVVGPAGTTDIPAEPGSFTQIACPNGKDMMAQSINNRMQITGACGDLPYGASSGFIFSNGQVKLFSYPGAELTRGNSINDAGAVAGMCRLPSHGPGFSTTIGFAYDGSQFAPVAYCGNPNSARGSISAANAINNKGQIAGSNCGSGSGDRGFLASPTASNSLRLSANGQ
jgi:uncharacterized membrane protein